MLVVMLEGSVEGKTKRRRIKVTDDLKGKISYQTMKAVAKSRSSEDSTGDLDLPKGTTP